VILVLDAFWMMLPNIAKPFPCVASNQRFKRVKFKEGFPFNFWGLPAEINQWLRQYQSKPLLN